MNHARAFALWHPSDSKVAVLYYWNVSRCPFLWKVVNLDLLLCTGLYNEPADFKLFRCLMFTQRPTWMNGWAKQWALPWSETSFISDWKNSFATAQNLQSVKTFKTSENSKNDSTFSWSKPVATSSYSHQTQGNMFATDCQSNYPEIKHHLYIA